jgi:ATP-dependent Clp protease ATP-binding subunit ClpA
MYEKLTPSMDKVIKTSQRIARDYDQDYVGTEHLLLAIIEEKAGIGAAILKDRGVTLGNAKTAVDKLMKKSMEDTWVFGRLPGTPHFRNVMSVAIEEARQLESKVVCTEHLLVALAREDGSVAQAALMELGLRAGQIRAEITKRMESAATEIPSSDE